MAMKSSMISPDIGRKIILLNARQIFRENIGSHIILLAMEDITERKLAEERIGEVIRQQQAILDNIPNIAWLKDRKGRYVAVNDPFGKAFGVAPKDLVGKNDHDIYPPEMAVKYEKDSREVMATGTRTYFEESLLIGRGRSSTWRRSKRLSLMTQEWSSGSSASPMTLPAARKWK